jgi:hypothetical protein
MQRWNPFEDAEDRKTVNRLRQERTGGGGACRIAKPSDYAPIEDALDLGIEMAEAVFRHAIADLRERPAIGLDLLETF